MNKPLEDIAHLYYGPYEKTTIRGAVKYLVSSHFDSNLEPTLFSGSFIDNENTNERYLLRNNDVIITGKGQRFFAWAYKSEYGQVVPSSLFFIVKILDPNLLLGEYLACYLNSPRVAHKIKTLAGGTSIPSIQKTELLQIEILIPPIEQQKKIVEFENLLNKDIELTTRLLDRKLTIKATLLDKVINEKMQEQRTYNEQ